MDGQSIKIMEMCEDLAKLSKSSINVIDKCLEQQMLTMDILFDKFLQQAQRQKQKDSVDNVPKNKMPNRQLKYKNEQVGDLFAAEPSFQKQAFPPICRTERRASITTVGKVININESQTISSGASIRESRARALSTFMNASFIDCPKANSTFIVNKKCMGNAEECLSPLMFSPEKTNKTYIIKSTSSDKSYGIASTTETNATKKLNKNIISLPKEPFPINVNCHSVTNKSSTKTTTKKKGEEIEHIKREKREKLGDIDVNVEEHVSQHMPRTTKKKLLEDKIINEKKANVIYVPLEKQVSTHLKPVDKLFQSPHQIRENKAEKRKELYLKSKADQRNFEDKHMKAAKQREDQMKRFRDKIKKAAEEKRKKKEKQKENKFIMKKITLKKQKQAKQ